MKSIYRAVVTIAIVYMFLLLAVVIYPKSYVAAIGDVVLRSSGGIGLLVVVAVLGYAVFYSPAFRSLLGGSLRRSGRWLKARMGKKYIPSLYLGSAALVILATASLIYFVAIAPWVGSLLPEEKKKAAEVAKAVEAMPTTTGTSIAFGILVIVVLSIIAHVVYENWGSWSKIWEHEVFIAIGIVLIVNAMLYLTLFPAWDWFWNRQQLFWSVNLLVILFIFLRTRTNKYSKYASNVVLVLIAAAFISQLTETVKRREVYASGRNGTASDQPIPAKHVPEGINMDTALQIIGECESGNQQFDADGQVLRNKEGSSAVGQYQILESTWGKKADELGYDLETKEGNRKMAEWLFTNYGTSPWEADRRSKSCWEPELRSFSSTNGFNLTTIEAGTQWENSTIVQIPSVKPGLWLFWESLDKKGYKVRINNSENLTFTSADAIPQGVVIRQLAFVTIEGDKNKIRVFFAPKI